MLLGNLGHGKLARWMGEISKTEFSQWMHARSGAEAPWTTERSVTWASHVDVFLVLSPSYMSRQSLWSFFGGMSYQHERHSLSSVINWTILICIKSRPSRDYADSHMAPWSVNWPCHIHHAPRGLISIGKKKKKKVWDLSTWHPSMDLVCVWCAFTIGDLTAAQG